MKQESDKNEIFLVGVLLMLLMLTLNMIYYFNFFKLANFLWIENFLYHELQLQKPLFEFTNLLKRVHPIRLAFCVFIALIVWNRRSIKMNKGDDEENRPYIHATTITLILLVIIGFEINYYYGLYLYPIIIFLSMYFIAKSVNLLRTTDLEGPSSVSNLPGNQMSFHFITDKGPMCIHSPQQGIYVDGGAGSGKCLAKGTQVIMFDGTLRNVENIKIGDMLMGPDSKPRNVLSLSNGKDKMYTIKQFNTFANDYVVNSKHILTLYSNAEKNLVDISIDFFIKNSVYMELFKGVRMFNNEIISLSDIKIEFYGVSEYYGFSIDGDCRFLLSDYTVTHNSASLIEPIIYQAILKNHNLYIYDFKGNPPTLGTSAYNAILKLNEKLDDASKMKYRQLAPSNILISHRANPIAPRFLENDLFVQNYAKTIFLNLSPDAKKKYDYWAQAGVSVIAAAIHFLKRNYPQFCTFPHVIELILNKSEILFQTFSRDRFCEKIILDAIEALEKEAGGQLSGIIGSAQKPLTQMRNANIYWVFSKDDIDFNINKKDVNTTLAVANDPPLRIALAPVIGLTGAVTMALMNQQGRNPSGFYVDEIPTCYFDDIDNLPGTGRSNKVVTLIACQSFAQLERDYSKENARVILGNLGNQFFGMSNEDTTAKKVVEMFGEKKYTDYSYSENDGGGSSTSESTKKEKILQLKDVQGQKVGHFYGKIASGEPPLFGVQMPFVENKKLKWSGGKWDFSKAVEDGNTYLYNPDGTYKLMYKKEVIPNFGFEYLSHKTDDFEVNKTMLLKLVDLNFKRIEDEIIIILKHTEIIEAIKELNVLIEKATIKNLDANVIEEAETLISSHSDNNFLKCFNLDELIEIKNSINSTCNNIKSLFNQK